MKIKHVNEFLEDPATSDWFKMALRSALERDPVDAANDAEVLFSVLRSQCNMLLNHNGPYIPPKFIEFGTRQDLCSRCNKYADEFGFCDCLRPLDDEAP